MIKTVSKIEALADYDKLKKHAISALKNENFIDANNFVIAASKTASLLNFRYSDDELEEILTKMSSTLTRTSTFSPVANRYVLYDYFGLDNRGLTQQYISALKMKKVEFLYILENHTNNAEEILRCLKSIEKAEVLVVPKNTPYFKKIEIISRKITEYKPEKAFLHLAPYSTTSIIIWNSFPNVTRFLIDLTDHAFWLGKCCCDYFIEFRDYGCNIAVKHRGIDSRNIIKQNFYPIVNNCSFRGFPEKTKKKTIIFTGAAYYKMYGENNRFLEILKRICLENQGAVILLAGNGYDRPLKKYIKINKLQDQVLLIGSRRDINEVFKNIDIYLNTFPVIGGLMSQYAVINEKPLIGYTTSDIPCNFTEDLFNSDMSIAQKFTYDDLEEFHNEINKLIDSREYRKSKIKGYENLLPKKADFSSNLFSNIQNIENYTCVFKNIEIDIDRFSNIYFNVENRYQHMYHSVKLSKLGLTYFKYDKAAATISFLNSLFYQRKEIFRRFKKIISRS